MKRYWVRAALLAAIALPAISGAAGAERLANNPEELRRALGAAQPGDAVVMADGEWRNLDLVFRGNGTAQAPITLRAQRPGQVVISGESRLRMAGEHLIVEGLWFRQAATTEDVVQFRASSREHAHHCRLTQCAITDCNPADLNEDTKWISLYGSDNRVDRCWIEGKRNAGTTLVVWLSDEPNRHHIEGNYFGQRPRLGENGGETIRVGDSKWSLHESLTVVERNVFERCSGEIEIISNKSCGNVYRHNLFLECEGALALRHGNRCTVEGNVFLGQGQRHTGGVRIIGEDHRVFNNYFEGLRGDAGRSAVSCMMGIPDSPLSGYAQVRRASVVFNTFVDCAHPFAIGVDGGDEATLPPQDVVIACNVLSSAGEKVLGETPRGVGLRAVGNLLEGTGQELRPAEGFSVADLMLERTDDGLMRPGPRSGVIDAGMNDFDFVTHDLDGQPRTGRPDAGCDEVLQGGEAAALSGRPIGPDWKPWRQNEAAKAAKSLPVGVKGTEDSDAL